MLHQLDRTGTAMERTQRLRYQSVVPWIETACLFLLAALLLWKGVLPGLRSLYSDFSNYYLAARLLHEGYSLDRIYDWVWLQRIKDHWGIDQTLVGFAGLTPFSALPILPIATLPALLAKQLWILANILFLWGTTEILNRIASLGRRRIWIVSLLAIFPLRTSFLLGQMHILVLFLLTLAYWFYRRRQAGLCGICLSIAGSLKIYPFLFLFYFVWKKQWREALSTFCFSVVLFGIGYVAIGREVILTYLTQVLPRSLQGEILDPFNASTASWAALLHRLFLFEPELNPSAVYSSSLLYAIIYPLGQITILLPVFAGISPSSDRDDAEHLQWAAFLFSLLLLSPVPSSYHFVVVILSMTLLLDVLVRRRQDRIVILAIVCYCLISTIWWMPAATSGKFSFFTFLAFGRLWSGICLWLLFLLCLRWEHGPFRTSENNNRRAAQLVFLFSITWAMSFWSYQKHFAYLKEDISRRIQLPVHAYLAAGIHARSDGFLFTAMMPQGYRVLDQNGQEVWKEIGRSRPADQLSSATAANLSPAVLELADTTGSRIVEVPPRTETALQRAEAWPQDSNAETPALSRDGSSLAFLKEEEKGRHSLWIAHRQLGSTQGNFTNPVSVVPNSYDVRDEVFTPSGDIVFTARVNGKTNIFRVVPGMKPVLLISENEDVDSPAISVDERFVLFRELLHYRWQLAIIDVTTRQKRYLTFGDCNAYNPAWLDKATLGYATDCGRGLGMTALAKLHITY